MGRLKRSRVDSRRMRTARRAFGAGDAPMPLYAPGTPRWDGVHPALAKAEAAEHRRLVAEGRRVVAQAQSEGRSIGGVLGVDFGAIDASIEGSSDPESERGAP